MNKLAVLLLRTFIGPFIVTFLIALFILDMQFLWVYADDLMGKGLELTVVVELMIYASARLVNMALPLALLISSIMTLGALAENYELTAMKTAGLSLFRILRPLTLFIVFISVAAFYFSNNIWPIANLKFRTLLYSVTKQKPALNLVDGVFYDGIEGFSIRVTTKDAQTGELSDVLIYDHRDPTEGSTSVIRAKRGEMQQTNDKRYLLFTLYDGFSYEEQKEERRRPDEKTFPHVSNQFEKQIMRIDLSSLAFNKADEDLFKNAYEMMTIEQLNVAVDSLRGEVERKQDDIIRYGGRTLMLLRDTLQLAEAEPRREDYRTDSTTVQLHYLNEFSVSQQQRIFSQAIETSRNFHKTLENMTDEIKARTRMADRYDIEWHRKFFLAFSCIVLFFIGAPLGAIIRKGGMGLPTLVAIILFLVYYIVTIFGERMIKSGAFEPLQGMWISTLLLFPMSVFLTYKAATDSSIMNIDAYVLWFKKLFVRKKKNNEDPSTVS